MVAVAVLMRRAAGATREVHAVNTLVFDIETVPDTELGRRLYGLQTCPTSMSRRSCSPSAARKPATDFLSHEQHRVVAISVAMRSRDTLKVWSLGEEGSSEKDLIERFFDGLDKYTPDLVSWNGVGIRFAGAPLPQPAAQRHRGPLLGDRRQRLELSLQQLSEPFSLASHGSDGHFVGIPGTGARQPAGRGEPAGAAGQARHATAARFGRCTWRAA